MNKGRIVLGIGLIVLAGVIFTVSSSAQFEFFGFENNDDDQNKITTTEAVKDIRAINADGAVRVHISPSDSEYVRYVFNDERMKNESSFEDGILRIKFRSKKKGFKLFGYSSSAADVYASVKKLELIKMDGVGSVRTKEELEVNDIKIVNDGTGSMNLQLKAKNIIGKNEGVGSMKIVGESDSATLLNEGVGSLNAGKLIVQVLSAKNDGVGSMEVRAEKEIELRNSGVGSISYSGDAVVRKKVSKGVGSISKR